MQTPAEHSPSSVRPGHVFQGTLPEDDGMQALRQQLQKVNKLSASADEKARRMHQLMSNHDGRDRMLLPELATRPHPTSGPLRASPPPPLPRPSPAELAPTFHPIQVPVAQPGDDIPPPEPQGPIHGCEHYQRNVKVQCHDCSRWYTCRHCHDLAPDLPWPHHLNRKATENMLCMLCSSVQPAGPICITCGTEAAYYYCEKCKLWDNDSSKRIYHCDDCGICRRGEGLGRDYIHCKRCNVCISISVAATHPCIERATDCDCPLCLEYLYTSNTPVVSLFCGHYMHAECYKDLMNVTYRCPICSKSAVNMELQWRKLDDEIAMQPMPEADFEDGDSALNHSPAVVPNPMDETDTRLAAGLGSLQVLVLPTSPASSRRRLPRRVWVGCNDCGGRGWANFHWLGLKCEHCDGYNTMQMTPIGRHETTRHRVECQRHHDLTGAEAMRSFGRDDEDIGEHILETDHVDRSGMSPSQDQSIGRQTRSISVRPYFRSESDNSRRLSVGLPGSLEAGSPSFLPYDILRRVGRSLSPMRSYIDGFGPGADGDIPAPTSINERLGANIADSGHREDETADNDDDNDDDDDDDADDDDNDDDDNDDDDDQESDDELDWSDSQPDADQGDDFMEIFGHR